MEATLSDLEVEQASRLIGDIYDCAIDPGRWPETLQSVQDLLTCANAVLYLYDGDKLSYRLKAVVGVDAEWERRMFDYDADIASIYNYLGNAMIRPFEDYFVLRRDLPDEFLFANRYFTEWAGPQGISDLIQATLMREPGRLALLAMGRFERDGRISRRELMLMDLLAPHMRRALKISDVIDMKTIEASTLDEITTPLFVVAADRRLLHANPAARELLATSSALGLGSDGRIRAADPHTTERLLAGIQPGRWESGAGGSGGIILSGTEETLAIAHVLPLAVGPAGERLRLNAAAAILVTSMQSPSGLRLTVIAETFGLTPAETRVLEHLCRGMSISETSKSLGIAHPTTKTHLARILSKTGTRRQAELLAVVNRLTTIPLASDTCRAAGC